MAGLLKANQLPGQSIYVHAFVQKIMPRAKETGLLGYWDCGSEKTNETEELDLKV